MEINNYNIPSLIITWVWVTWKSDLTLGEWLIFGQLRQFLERQMQGHQLTTHPIDAGTSLALKREPVSHVTLPTRDQRQTLGIKRNSPKRCQHFGSDATSTAGVSYSMTFLFRNNLPSWKTLSGWGFETLSLLCRKSRKYKSQVQPICQLSFKCEVHGRITILA